MTETKEPYFSPEEEEQIISAIRLAEEMTSGEIRVHISQKADSDSSLEVTKSIFQELRMFNTQQRNAVLLHISFGSKTFCIFGDEGIDNVVPNDFWETTRDIIQSHFKNGKIVEGICQGVKNVGKELKQHFPLRLDNKNELADDITYD